jgi:hypothetical protein
MVDMTIETCFDEEERVIERASKAKFYPAADRGVTVVVGDVKYKRQEVSILQAAHLETIERQPLLSTILLQ